jgi:hypothetical protein
MSLSSVRLSLLVGRVVPRPAPASLMNALEKVTVNQSDDGDAGFSQGFELTFRAQRDPVVGKDYALLSSSLLKPGNRVVISVTLNATPRVLMDGIITRHDLTPSSGAAGTSLAVKGTDLSLLMDMLELSLGYPGLSHEAIVLLILAKYAAFGVVPRIIPVRTSWTSTPLEKMDFQEGTDRDYLRQLAKAHGYIFGIKPGPVPLTSSAYWGSRVKIGLPQKALTVDMGAATNVESISFGYDAMAPKQVYGLVALPDSPIPLPVLTMVSTQLPPLASRPALLANQPFVKKVRLKYNGRDPIEAWAKAQDQTDESSESVVNASGTLDALRYGGLLTAPGIVGVRGVGYSYDGYYYVKNVNHQISRGEYKQNFTLTREGTGSLTQKV